jgi:hypothetical protein
MLCIFGYLYLGVFPTVVLDCVTWKLGSRRLSWWDCVDVELPPRRSKNQVMPEKTDLLVLLVVESEIGVRGPSVSVPHFATNSICNSKAGRRCIGAVSYYTLAISNYISVDIPYHGLFLFTMQASSGCRSGEGNQPVAAA